MTEFNETQRLKLESLPTHQILSLTETVKEVTFGCIGDIEEYATIYTAKPYLSKIEILCLSQCLSGFPYTISHTESGLHKGLILNVYV